jgi:molecular chaperone DnaK
VLSGDVKDMVLLDVTPLSLGIETMGRVMTNMIPRNTTLPTQRKETFSTASDDQPSVEVHVLQGERPESRYNRTLGKFQLEGLLPAARGVPKIEVTFDVDANGILSVTAKDTATGKDQKITITASSGLGEAEIQRMVKEAVENQADDKVRREQVEHRNKLDNLCYTLTKSLRENKEKLSAGDVSAMEALLKEGQDALDKQDDGLVTGVLPRLEAEAHRIASALYGAHETEGSSKVPEPKPPATGGERGRPGVVDAEFEEMRPGGP